MVSIGILLSVYIASFIPLLETAEKTNLVGAINEVNADVDLVGGEIGDLTLLTTDVKTDTVSAINEVDANADANTAEIIVVDSKVNDAVLAITELQEAHKFYGTKAVDIIVPDTYPATPHAEMVATGLVPGRYKIEYSFQADFNTQKDKVMNFQLTGEFAGVEFGKSISTANLANEVGHNYSFYKDLTATDITWGIHFRDATGGQGFSVDFIDLMLQRVGDTPIP